MALSGIIYGTTSNPRLKPQIVWSAVQSVEGNYSDITASLQYTRSNAGYTSGGNWTGSLTIGEETVKKSLYMEITYGNVTTVITHTARVYHDDRGEKKLTLSGTGGITYPAEASLKKTEISGEITLDPIPRASGVSATDCYVGGCSTVVIAKKSEAFQSALAFRFGDLSGFVTGEGTVAAQEEKFSNTVLNFQVPEDFYQALTNAPSGPCYLVCHTYQGQTLIGSRETEFTVTAAESLCAPEAALTVYDHNPATVALTGDAAVLVQNASQAVCTLTATAKNGASIAQKQVAGQTPEGDTLTLTPVRTHTIAYSVTDSRGYTTQGIYAPQVIAYIPPTANVTLRRESPTADAGILTVSGQCFWGSFGQAENELQVTVEEASTGLSQTLTPEPGADNTYTLTARLEGFAYNRSFTLTVRVEDKLCQLQKTAQLLPGVPVFDWGEGDFRFHVPVYAPKLYVNEAEITA